MFSEQIHSRALAAKLKPIQNSSVEQYLRSLGRIFAAVGNTDTRLNTIGGLKLTIGQYIAPHAHQDPHYT